VSGKELEPIMRKVLPTVMLLVLLAAAAASADSRFAAPHLGLPVSSSDARSRAMAE